MSTSTALPVEHVTQDEFDAIREADALEAEQAYCVATPFGGEGYAWSPDGIGCYWYDTLDELEAEHA